MSFDRPTKDSTTSIHGYRIMSDVDDVMYVIVHR